MPPVAVDSRSGEKHVEPILIRAVEMQVGWLVDDRIRAYDDDRFIPLRDHWKHFMRHVCRCIEA